MYSVSGCYFNKAICLFTVMVLLLKSKPNFHFVGIPESYRLFYALGATMAIQGILSECYHVCPTAENFQFDTTFMYVIAPLVFIKVHQF